MKLGKFELDNVYCGDCEELMKDIPSNKVDLIVTDPPYGYGFMGKEWDTFEPKGAYQYKKGFKQLPRHSPDAMIEFFVPIWKESLRILKSGGFAFIMCSPRQDVLMKQTQALSEAGFNTGFTSIYWTYASGFPKATNISLAIDKQECKKQLTKKLGRKPTKKEFEKAWEEFAPIKEIRKGAGKNPKGLKFDEYGQSGGHLKSEYKERILISSQARSLKGSYAGFQPKPAVEVIIIAMKPLSEKTYIDQALKNRKGITWLDDGKIPYESEKNHKIGHHQNIIKSKARFYDIEFKNPPYSLTEKYEKTKGRFPANLLVSNDILNDGIFRQPAGNKGISNRNSGFGCPQRFKPAQYNDGQSFSRYFDLDKWAVAKGVKDTFPFLIVPKASKSEKNRGLENFKKTRIKGRDEGQDIRNVPYKTRPTPIRNIHPTVKPIKLTSYLITLGSREGDILVDNFCGSGSTLVSAKMLNRRFLGFDTEREYVEISKARLSAIKYVQEKLL